jgi:sulfur-oxidizing protein SoxY
MVKATRRLFGCALWLLCAGAQAQLDPSQLVNPKPTDDPNEIVIWRRVQASLFGGRPVVPAPAGMLKLEVPARAIDAAVVPLAIRAVVPAGAPVQISKLYLIIDANPSPVSGIFQVAAQVAGQAGGANSSTQIETRVRIDGYSFVRAIAEMTDGKLYGVTRFVKASGGCSAPPTGDLALAASMAGRMSLQITGDPAGSEPMQAQLSISHPNHSGLALDQVSRQFTPAHYVRKVEIKQGSRLLFSADVDFSMSENPSFRFQFAPQGTGELVVNVEDSQGKKFAMQQAPTATPR